ncbi:MAG: NADH-quinone oxidoreductase subunit NuoF [Spirochaetales bacterium]|nr:NADH-quinone oxidoreductase subunit NuoF [Spirochaetales bacterium]
MKQINSINDFNELREYLTAHKETDKPTIVIPAGTCSQASGANDLIRIAKRELLEKNLTGKINLLITGCHGLCQMEPSVLIEPDRTFYPRVGMEEMVKIIQGVSQGKVIKELLFVDEKTGNPVEKQDDLPFFSKQQRTLLEHNEKIDPIRINHYIKTGGYSALINVLKNNTPGWVIKEITLSGLRGRGGAGFPTGKKWQMLAAQPVGKGKYLVCNADEGDPGAYMDRSILEGNPHSIIEGMIIGAYATGATEGIIYVRNEYPLAIKHLRIALKQAHKIRLLGENILGTDFSFDIRIVKGAGAFVCGEETALIQSIEGKMGEPRQRPPFPIQKGINSGPTLINNVETWANIPVIINSNASKFVRTGTTNNSGTKIFSLVGKVKYTGLVEVPMGTPINEIIYNIGGGPVNNSKIKAVQTGGPSGGCIPSDLFYLPIDYESLSEAGSIMGSGGMIVMDDTTCMIDVAKYFMNFLKDESCGKCYTCRKGTQRMYEILDDISTGKADMEILDVLEKLALTVKDTTMCGLGQTAANPVLSTLRYFREEYLAHIADKRCPAGVCKELITYSINEQCTGCSLCVKKCPEQAISGQKKEQHVIDSSKCIKCGICKSACPSNAITVA